MVAALESEGISWYQMSGREDLACVYSGRDCDSSTAATYNSGQYVRDRDPVTVRLPSEAVEPGGKANEKDPATLLLVTVVNVTVPEPL